MGLRALYRVPALPGQLDRGLVGLRSAVAEERAGKSGETGEPPRRFDLLRDLVEVRDVHVARRLLGDRADERGVGVAEARHRDPSDEVQVLPALQVEQP